MAASIGWLDSLKSNQGYFYLQPSPTVEGAASQETRSFSPVAPWKSVSDGLKIRTFDGLKFPTP